MTDQKMGTQHARDICHIFREIAETTTFEDLKGNLLSLANELEPIASKVYFKTQKGTEDLEGLAAEAALLKEKLCSCELSNDAHAVCAPIVDELQKVMHHAKTMKVRMT